MQLACCTFKFCPFSIPSASCFHMTCDGSTHSCPVHSVLRLQHSGACYTLDSWLLSPLQQGCYYSTPCNQFALLLLAHVVLNLNDCLTGLHLPTYSLIKQKPSMLLTSQCLNPCSPNCTLASHISKVLWRCPCMLVNPASQAKPQP